MLNKLNLRLNIEDYKYLDLYYILLGMRMGTWRGTALYVSVRYPNTVSVSRLMLLR